MRLWISFHLENASAVASVWILAKVIEQAQPRGCIEGQQRFVLGVNGGEVRRQLAQDRDGCRLVIDENPSLAASGNLAPQDDGFVFLINPVIFENLSDRFFRSAFDFKDSGDRGLVGSGTNHVGGGFVAQQERQRIDEDGFSRAGFAGQQVQAGRELYRQVIYDRVVFQPQFDEHRRPGKKIEIAKLSAA